MRARELPRMLPRFLDGAVARQQSESEKRAGEGVGHTFPCCCYYVCVCKIRMSGVWVYTPPRMNAPAWEWEGWFEETTHGRLQSWAGELASLPGLALHQGSCVT